MLRTRRILGKRRILIILLAVVIAVSSIIVGWLVWGPQHNTPKGSVQPEVKISYSSSYTSMIDGVQPSSGRTFLVIHLTVSNMGYHNFTANPFRDMYIVVNGQSHNVSAAYIFLSNPFPASNLNNTGSAAGDVVFEVPQGSTSFTPGWRVPSNEGIRLDWVAS